MTNPSRADEQTNFEKFSSWFKVYWSVFGFIIPYLGAVLFFMIIGEQMDDGSISKHSFSKACHESIKSNFTLFLAFLFALAGSYRVYHKHQKQLMSTLVIKSNVISKNVDSYLKKAKIVFESGINDFDSKHLLALRRILNSLNTIDIKNTQTVKENISIYAIDNSDPRTWWSDTMTGYLALLSNWHSHNSGLKNGQVSRVFVCQSNELMSPIFAKTITLHSLMGFKTFVLSIEMYKILFETFTPSKGEKIINEKEVLLWTKRSETTKKEKTTITEKPIEIDFVLDKLGEPKTWKSVKGYQSYWDVGSDYYKRNLDSSNVDTITKLMNYYDKDVYSSDIDILFDFIAIENKPKAKGSKKYKFWNNNPEQHLEFINYIIEKSICCKDRNEIPDNPDQAAFGIEIKTSNCNDCTKRDKEVCDHRIKEDAGIKFDFVSNEKVTGILIEYYNSCKF